MPSVLRLAPAFSLRPIMATFAQDAQICIGRCCAAAAGSSASASAGRRGKVLRRKQRLLDRDGAVSTEAKRHAMQHALTWTPCLLCSS